MRRRKQKAKPVQQPAPPKAVIRHRGRRAKRSRDPGTDEIMNKAYRRKLTDPFDHA
jgi:hypothetical protein